MIMQNIRPSAELRNKYNEISNLCKETREPVYITVNGHGDTVILSLEQFNQMQAELELLKMLAEAEDDVHNFNSIYAHHRHLLYRQAFRQKAGGKTH